MKKVAVVGGGLSGLTSVKCCMEAGLEPTCFEMSESIGGLWAYREEIISGLGSVASTTFTNTSKYAMSFSDFPMPVDWPVYNHHEQIFQYLKLYAEHFNLLPHVRLRQKVVHISQTEDHEVTGRWNVHVQNVTTNACQDFVFDAIMVCSGIFSFPNTPSYPGMNHFRGEIMHSQQFRTAAPFIDKNVLVIGNGNTACDAICDIAAVAQHPVYMSTRRGMWIIEKDSSTPSDIWSASYFMRLLMYYIPSFLDLLLVPKMLKRFDYAKHNIYPSRRITIDQLVVSNRMIPNLLQKSIRVIDGIDHFTSSGVILKDGSSINVDAVLFATGYSVSIPFLDKHIIDPEDWHVYKRVWPAHLDKDSLALIGFVRQTGPVGPSVELQARWAAKVFSGRAKLPESSVMYKRSFHHTRESPRRLISNFTEDLVIYPNDVASQIHCEPPLSWWLLFTKPWLWFKHLFMARPPYVYRLYGDDHWANAEHAIEDMWNQLK